MRFALMPLVSLLLISCCGNDAWCADGAPAFEAELISQVSLRQSGVPISNIAVTGSQLALGTGIAAAQQYDMSDPEHPGFLGDMHVGGRFELLTDLAWHAGDVYVSVGIVGTPGVRIFDGSDPLAVEPIGSAELGMIARMAFDGPYMYTMGQPYTGDIHELHVTDISDPTSPVTLSSSAFAASYDHLNLGNLEVHQGYVYLACGAYGMLVWDATTPETPVLVGGHATQASVEDLAVFEPYPSAGAFLAIANGADGLLLLDVREPDSPEYVAAYPIDEIGGVMTSVLVHDDLCFAVVDGVGLVVLDISNAFDIQQVGLIPEIHGAMSDIAIEGDLLYVIESELLRVFKITTEGDSGCQNLADINGDRELNFYDVSSFLTAFIASEPVGDFDGNGAWDFFDVSGFLTAFNAGCP